MEPIMFRRTGILWIAVMTVLIVTGTRPRPASAQEKAPTPKAQDKVALGENEVKQLLLLMDTDKNGKISKQEYMSYMEAEFERLDKDKNGELDAKELTRSSLRVSHPVPVGK